MKGLLIIDVQLDLMREMGALAKNSEGELYAQHIIDPILSKIREYKKYELPIILASLWLQDNDLPVKTLGKHCIANTDGAKIITPFTQELAPYQNHISIIYHNSYDILSSGTLAQENQTSEKNGNLQEQLKDLDTTTTSETRQARERILYRQRYGNTPKASKTLEVLLKERNITSLDVMGIAASTTITDTVVSLLSKGFKVNLYKPGIADFDNKLINLYLYRLKRFYGANILEE